MNVQHKNLAGGRWNSLSFFEQMAHVGSEVARAITWREKGNAQYGHMAFERALELLDLTVADEKNKKRLKELLRLRETLADYFAFENSYRSSAKSFRSYFSAFNFAARKGL